MAVSEICWKILSKNLKELLIRTISGILNKSLMVIQFSFLFSYVLLIAFKPAKFEALGYSLTTSAVTKSASLVIELKIPSFEIE